MGLTYWTGRKKITAVFVFQLQLHLLVLFHHPQPDQTGTYITVQ
jgi:hypothetical protein